MKALRETRKAQAKEEEAAGRKSVAAEAVREESRVSGRRRGGLRREQKFAEKRHQRSFEIEEDFEVETDNKSLCCLCGGSDGEDYGSMINCCSCSGGSTVAHLTCVSESFCVDNCEKLPKCETCNSVAAVDGSRFLDSRMPSKLEAEVPKPIDPDLNWKTNVKTPKSYKRAVRRARTAITTGLKKPRNAETSSLNEDEPNDSSKQDEETSVSESEKMDCDFDKVFSDTNKASSEPEKVAPEPEKTSPEMEKAGVSILERRYSGLASSVPIKKRRITIFRSPSPPPREPSPRVEAEPVSHSGEQSNVQHEEPLQESRKDVASPCSHTTTNQAPRDEQVSPSNCGQSSVVETEKVTEQFSAMENHNLMEDLSAVAESKRFVLSDVTRRSSSTAEALHAAEAPDSCELSMGINIDVIERKEEASCSFGDKDDFAIGDAIQKDVYKVIAGNSTFNTTDVCLSKSSREGSMDDSSKQSEGLRGDSACSRDDRMHWDLNTVMDAWETPLDETETACNQPPKIPVVQDLSIQNSLISSEGLLSTVQMDNTPEKHLHPAMSIENKPYHDNRPTTLDNVILDSDVKVHVEPHLLISPESNAEEEQIHLPPVIMEDPLKGESENNLAEISMPQRSFPALKVCVEPGQQSLGVLLEAPIGPSSELLDEVNLLDRISGDAELPIASPGSASLPSVDNYLTIASLDAYPESALKSSVDNDLKISLRDVHLGSASRSSVDIDLGTNACVREGTSEPKNASDADSMLKDHISLGRCELGGPFVASVSGTSICEKSTIDQHDSPGEEVKTITVDIAVDDSSFTEKCMDKKTDAESLFVKSVETEDCKEISSCKEAPTGTMDSTTIETEFLVSKENNDATSSLPTEVNNENLPIDKLPEYSSPEEPPPDPAVSSICSDIPESYPLKHGDDKGAIQSHYNSDYESDVSREDVEAVDYAVEMEIDSEPRDDDSQYEDGEFRDIVSHDWDGDAIDDMEPEAEHVDYGYSDNRDNDNLSPDMYDHVSEPLQAGNQGGVEDSHLEILPVEGDRGSSLKSPSNNRSEDNAPETGAGCAEDSSKEGETKASTRGAENNQATTQASSGNLTSNQVCIKEMDSEKSHEALQNAMLEEGKDGSSSISRRSRKDNYFDEPNTGESVRRIGSTVFRAIPSRIEGPSYPDSSMRRERIYARGSRIDPYNDISHRSERGIGRGKFIGRGSSHMHARGRGGESWVDASGNRYFRRRSPNYSDASGYGRSGARNPAAVAAGKLHGSGVIVTRDGTVLRPSGTMRRQSMHMSGRGIRNVALRRGSPTSQDESLDFGMEFDLEPARDMRPERINVVRERLPDYDHRMVGLRPRGRYRGTLSDDRLHMENGMSRTDRSFSPTQRRGSSRMLYRGQSKSPPRSRTRSPPMWSSPRGRSTGGDDGMEFRRPHRSPQFRSDNRTDRIKSTQRRPLFVDHYDGFVPSSRERVSPSHAVRWIDDRKNWELREEGIRRPNLDRSPPTRRFTRGGGRRYDIAGSPRRLKPNEYYSSIHSGGSPEFLVDDRGTRYEVLEDDRRKHGHRYVVDHSTRTYEIEGDMRRFYNSEEEFRARDSRLKVPAEFQRRRSPRDPARSIHSRLGNGPRKVPNRGGSSHLRYGREARNDPVEFKTFELKEGEDEAARRSS